MQGKWRYSLDPSSRTFLSWHTHPKSLFTSPELSCLQINSPVVYLPSCLTSICYTYMLSVFCVSVFSRLQSLQWVPEQSVPSWCSPDPSWCSPDPSPDPSSVLPWWAPAPPWRSSALSAPHWWAPALSALPWKSSALSALHWWAPAPSWRSSAPSAPLWWSAVWLWWSSAPLWWSAAPSALSWWSSFPPILPDLSWVPALPATPWLSVPWHPALLAFPQSPVPPLTHGHGPPSLPLFRLCSTTLLYCTIWGASGSHSLGGGLCHESGSWTSIH